MNRTLKRLTIADYIHNNESISTPDTPPPEYQCFLRPSLSHLSYRCTTPAGTITQRIQSHTTFILNSIQHNDNDSQRTVPLHIRTQRCSLQSHLQRRGRNRSRLISRHVPSLPCLGEVYIPSMERREPGGNIHYPTRYEEEEDSTEG